VQLPFFIIKLEFTMQASTQQSQASNTTTESNYFDLHTKGFGYLSRIRTVKPRKGEAFLACTVSALHGNKSDPNVTKFDLRASGEAAQNIVLTFKDDVEAQKKVIIGFVVGDIYPEAFEVEKDGQKEQRLVIKGRLLQVSFVKVDGVLIDLAQFKPAAEAQPA
jgi:Protein of unknown function (DUF3577)